jgi:hypothetical protein
MLSVHVRRLTLLLSLLAAVSWWCFVLWRGHGEIYFDDAYMFYRYAEHVRQGLGLSWNLDGVPSYGMTSLLWAAVVLVFSFLPVAPAQCLLLASWLMSGLAIVFTAFALWRNARSSWLRSPATAVALAAFSLLAIRTFRINARTGMETMLAMALLALFLGLVVGPAGAQRGANPLAIGTVAFLLALTRPEAVLPAVLFLLLSAFLLPSGSFRNVAQSLAVLACGLLLTMLLAKLYFHSWLPLSFYIKARDGYQGYRYRWYPVASALRFLQASGLFLLLLALFARRREARLLLLFALPLGAVILYLCTVTQIMGMAARYYVPYLPLLAVPAFLVLDARLAELGSTARNAFHWRRSHLFRLALAAIVVWFLADSIPLRLQLRLEALAERRVLSYHSVAFDTPAAPQLPKLDYDRALHEFADDLVSGLPDGATIAATEVGYLGARFPRIDVIDLSGLNDTAIARNGFSAAAVLERSPDLIWLPHDDYTYQRGVLLTDPLFLQRYRVYPGAMNYGIAILKSSPYRTALELRLAAAWQKLYPSSTPAGDLATGATWQRGTFVPAVDPVAR